MAIPLDPTRPIYLQIMEEIKKRAARGVYLPGSQLPSVRDMAKEMEVNPNTIARVYRELEIEEFIITRRGKGTFITENSNRIEEERKKFGHAATERFLNDITELELTEDQINELLTELETAIKSKTTGTKRQRNTLIEN